jgi:tetracycline resistance efflux pump
MSDPTWISVLPPVLAIVLAIWTRQVYLSLVGGVWLGWTILNGWNPLYGLGAAVEAIVAVWADPDQAKILMFTLVIGALIATVEVSGGVRGFVHWLEGRNWVRGGKGAQLLAWGIGVVIFIESNITVLVAGAVARPLIDRYQVSREKLAYLIDSTSAPICILVPLNAWGAYNLGILQGLGVEDALGVFMRSIPLNFYPLSAVLLALVTVLTGLDVGPMRRAEDRTRRGEIHWPQATPMIEEGILSPPRKEGVEPRAADMIVPILVMVVVVPLGLLATGDGVLTRGDGSTSVLWAVLAGVAAGWLLLLARRSFTVRELTEVGLKGAGGLVPLALVLLLALALKDVATELGTGPYLARVIGGTFAPVVFLPLVFVVASGIAFATGTSWGTFAIMLPIAVPAADALGLPLSPFVAASLSGGIFGDHCSPISDTTIISSMAAATDHIDHVRTQLPYALAAGVIAAVGFVLVGASL